MGRRHLMGETGAMEGRCRTGFGGDAVGSAPSSKSRQPRGHPETRNTRRRAGKVACCEVADDPEKLCGELYEVEYGPW